MASYGYGFGSSQSQGYSNVHQPSTFTQVSSGYANQFGSSAAPAQRQVVQQSFDVTGGYGYGYGRQQDTNQNSSIPSSHQTSYGTSSYMSRDAGYDASKSGYGYGASSQGSYVYGNQGMKQAGFSTGSSMYGSGQTMSHMSKQQSSQSFMSQPGVSSAGYVGYGSVRSQSVASGGYSATSQGSSTGYSNVGSSQVSSATSAPPKPRQPIANKPPQQQTQQQQPSQPAPSNTYDSVVFNAATSFLTQQTQQQKAPWQRQQKPQFKLHSGGDQRQRQGPRPPQQLHYCEVCKISCAGPMTYKEHLDGQKHKKKAASIVTTNKEPVPSGSYRCDLCDVTCTGIDAYNAHLKGARHVKTVKLHQKLGKPIPEFKPPEQIAAGDKKAAEAPKKVIQRPASKSVTAPKINFVGGTKLLSTATGTKEVEGKPEEKMQSGEQVDTSANINDGAMEEQEIVGEEYVENIKSDVGKVMGYKCTLCDCRFNDVVARTAHMKGRRHRLNYKKKVKPSLKVEMKGSKYANRMNRDRDRGNYRGRDQEVMWRQREAEQLRWEQELRIREDELRRWEEEEYLRRVEEDRYWTRPDHQRMQELEHYEWERRGRFFDPVSGRPEGPVHAVPDDKLVMAKHANIYPNETELKQVQDVVATTEKGLKLVSDQIAEEDQKAREAKKESENPKPAEVKDEPVSDDDIKKLEDKTAKATPSQAPRTLKGVMRVGVLAKGLLLHQKLDVELVVLCADKPTLTLLNRVGTLLPEKIKDVAEDKYTFVIDQRNCAIGVSTKTEPNCCVTVTLTSPVMRDTEEAEDEKADKPAQTAERDVLNKEKCLEALASLRHAKWFQARASGVQFCVIIIRIMRDLCTRIAAFNPLSEWAIELLVEKSLSSGPSASGPGEALRRVLEACASGVFLPGGCGLLDPCEKEKIDAAGNLTAQEREDITSAAQHALRLHAFRQVHTVLDIEPLKAPAGGRGYMRGKRRRDDSRENGNKSTVAKLQKKDESTAEGKPEETGA